MLRARASPRRTSTTSRARAPSNRPHVSPCASLCSTRTVRPERSRTKTGRSRGEVVAKRVIEGSPGLVIGASYILIGPFFIFGSKLAHAPATFDWKTINVRWSDCERVIRNPEFFADEQASRDQREFQLERKKLGKQQFVSLRPKLQAIFAGHGESPPVTFRPAISRL